MITSLFLANDDSVLKFSACVANVIGFYPCDSLFQGTFLPWDSFNRLFNEVGSKYGWIPHSDNEHRKHMRLRELNSFYFSPLSDQEVLEIADKFDKIKSSYDAIGPCICLSYFLQ